MHTTHHYNIVPSSDSDVITHEEGKKAECIQNALAAKDEAVKWGLDPLLVEHLQSVNIQYFFPIQRSILPHILASRKNDVCISAPTGSGKTLVYVLAVLQVRMNNGGECLTCPYICYYSSSNLYFCLRNFFLGEFVDFVLWFSSPIATLLFRWCH